MKYFMVDSKDTNKYGTIKAYLKDEETFPTEFTLEFFINFKADNNFTENVSILDYNLLNGSTLNVPIKIYAEKSTKNIVFYINGNTAKIATDNFEKIWNHISLNYSKSGNITFYVNGISILNKAASGMPFLNYAFRDFLFYVYSLTNEINITEIKIYNYVKRNIGFIAPSVQTDAYVAPVKDISIDFSDKESLVYLPMQELITEDLGTLKLGWSSSNGTYENTISEYSMSINMFDIIYNITMNMMHIIPGTSGNSHLISNNTVLFSTLSNWTIDFFYFYDNTTTHLNGQLVNMTFNSGTPSTCRIATYDYGMAAEIRFDSTASLLALGSSNFLAHFAIVCVGTNALKFYINGKQISSTTFSIVNQKIGLLTFPSTAANLDTIRIAHFRFTNSVLYNGNFDIGQEFFENQTIMNSFQSSVITGEEKIALQFPLRNLINSNIYSLGYSEDVTSRFRPEISSTKYISLYNIGSTLRNKTIPSISESRGLTTSIWDPYPVVGSNLLASNNDATDNKKVIFRFGKSLISTAHCIEFWLYIDFDETQDFDTFKNIIFITTFTVLVGLQVNKYGNIRIVTYSNTNGSVSIANGLDINNGSIYYDGINLVNSWNHIAFSTSGNNLLQIYINGKLTDTITNWSGYIHRICLFTGYKNDPLMPLFTGLKATLSNKRSSNFETNEKLELA